METKYTVGLATLLVLLASSGGFFMANINDTPNNFYKCDSTNSYKFCEKISSTLLTCTFYKAHIEEYGKTSERCNGGWKQVVVINDNIEQKTNYADYEICSVNGCVKGE